MIVYHLIGNPAVLLFEQVKLMENKTKDLSKFCLVIGFIFSPNQPHFKNTAANVCIS